MTMPSIDSQPALWPATCWLVTLCTDPRAWGVPLFCYVAEDGRVVETAVTPVSGEAEYCPDPVRALGCPMDHPSFGLLLQEALRGAPQPILDTVHAQVVHKPLVPPGGDYRHFHPQLPTAGLLLTAHGRVPAVAIGHHGTLTGVIMISACRGTATPRTGWVASDRFAPDRAGFADACAGVTHGNLLAEWEHTAPRLALEGAALLLKDPARRVPDLVIGAFVARLLEKFADHQPAAARGEELLALIRVAQGDVSRADLIAYADTLASLRQCLVLAATKRKPGREALYEELVGRPSWLTLFESIVDSMMRLHQISDGGQAPNQADVRRAIERVALGCRDAYTEQMATLRGRVMSGIGELATRPAHPRADENELERRFRQTAQLFGTSGWENARPYNAGVLAAAMGGW